MATKFTTSQKNKSLYNSIFSAVEQTTIALSVPGVIDRFVKLCGITPSEVYSLMFWDNAIIKSILCDVDAFCPAKQKIDSFKTFINHTFFKKLSPPNFNHKNGKVAKKNGLKSIAHKIRYCKMIFLLAQNAFNTHQLLSKINVSSNEDEDDSDSDIEYQAMGSSPLIFQILFKTLGDSLNAFSAILNANSYSLTCTPSIFKTKHNENETETKDNTECKYSSKFIIKELELIKWCFCAIFMLSWTVQSKMEIVDFSNGIIIKQMIEYFVILKYFVDNNWNQINIMRSIDNIRSIFLLLKKLCKTVPFPQRIYAGHNGGILLICEILIYCKSLTLKLENGKAAKYALNGNELELFQDTLFDIYFHAISVLECLNKKCDLIKSHLQRYQATKNELTHICVNRRLCRNLCFGFQKYYLRFCKNCGNDLFVDCNDKIEENGINLFIPNQVSIKEYKNYYFVALKKFCKQKEFKQFDNDDMLNVIVEYLNYECFVGDYVDFKDEIGNWCLFKVKEIDKRDMYQHRIKIGFADYKKKWDQWIDARSLRIAQPMTHSKATAHTRDDML